MPPAPPPSVTAIAALRRRLIPFLFLLYVVAYLDRVNIGFAALDMNRDLGFSATVYGLGSGIFFVSYTLLEVPSNLILARVGARVWIGRIMLTWGLVSIGMAFVPRCDHVLPAALPARRRGGRLLPRHHLLPHAVVPGPRARARGGALHDRDGDRRCHRRADLERSAAARRPVGPARLAVAVRRRRPAGDRCWRRSCGGGSRLARPTRAGCRQRSAPG